MTGVGRLKFLIPFFSTTLRKVLWTIPKNSRHFSPSKREFPSTSCVKQGIEYETKLLS
jgi:hypothetical protein